MWQWGRGLHHFWNPRSLSHQIPHLLCSGIPDFTYENQSYFAIWLLENVLNPEKEKRSNIWGSEKDSGGSAGGTPAAGFTCSGCWRLGTPGAGLENICKKWQNCRKLRGWECSPPERRHAHPLKANLWLDDPGVGKEAVHCLGQEELGRGVHLHTRKKVIRVNFELMSF